MSNDPQQSGGEAGRADAPSAGLARGPSTGDDFDGILLADNPMPRWWKGIFVATIFFAVAYFVFYHGGAEGRTLEDRYAAAAAENARLQFADIGELQGDAMTLAKYKDEPRWLRVGQSVFASNCVSCHGALGEGLVGPNLRDESYKNVRSIEDIYTVVTQGAAAGAMPAWGDRLGQNERVLVAAYVASLRGTDPEGAGKGPEGRPIPPWPEYVEPEPEPQAEPGDASEAAEEADAAGEGAGEAADAAGEEATGEEAADNSA